MIKKMKKMKKIILTGGGTAGHITPNIALVPYLSDYEIHYIGQSNSMEQKMVSRECKNVIFHAIECVKFRRSICLDNLKIPFRLHKSKCQAKALLEEIKPCCIFSKGGYVALPIMLAADKNIPKILHESDFSMGLANKLTAKKCTYVCTSFKELADKFDNGICTGAPLRQSLYFSNPLGAERDKTFSSSKKNLLIMGGSLGSNAINDAVADSIDALCNNYNIIHITGKNQKHNITHSGYKSIDFCSNIGDYFAWADMCVSRGGANSIFELVALKIPSLIIPLPKKVSRGDQVDNANYFEKMGLVEVLDQTKMQNDKKALINAVAMLGKKSSHILHACSTTSNIDGTATIAKLISKCADSFFAPQLTENTVSNNFPIIK